MKDGLHLKTLRSRVTTWYVSLLGAALLVFGAALFFGVQGYLQARLEHSLRADGQAISSTFLTQEETKGPLWMQGEIAEAYEPEISGRFIRVTRQDGKVLYQSGDTRDPQIVSSRVSRSTTQPSKEQFREQAVGGGEHLKIFELPYVSASGTKYVVEVGASTTPIKKVLTDLLKILLLIAPIILLAAAIGGHFMMTLALRPLVILTQQAERIGMQQFGERLPVIATGDEMERLSLSLNRMISRLEDALAHNQRFSADASHELRTPLTILRGELEQVLRAPGAPSVQREAIGSALEEIDRMARIVESLLTISRLDSGMDGMKLESVNLSELARCTVDQMYLMAEEKEIRLQSLQTGTVMIRADAGRIKQVLVNLLDNAIKYTPQGGTVTVAVTTASAGRVGVLEVADTGVGIETESLPHVFERFYRADKSRARESGGAGLGLSIVKAISNAHGANITIESVENEKTTVRFELPISASAIGLEMESSSLGSTKKELVQTASLKC